LHSIVAGASIRLVFIPSANEVSHTSTELSACSQMLLFCIARPTSSAWALQRSLLSYNWRLVSFYQPARCHILQYTTSHIFKSKTSLVLDRHSNRRSAEYEAVRLTFGPWRLATHTHTHTHTHWK
jgi:hypothetical protein